MHTRDLALRIMVPLSARDAAGFEFMLMMSFWPLATMQECASQRILIVQCDVAWGSLELMFLFSASGFALKVTGVVVPTCHLVLMLTVTPRAFWLHW